MKMKTLWSNCANVAVLPFGWYTRRDYRKAARLLSVHGRPPRRCQASPSEAVQGPVSTRRAKGRLYLHAAVPHRRRSPAGSPALASGYQHVIDQDKKGLGTSRFLVTYGPDLRPRMNHRRDAVSATWEGAASFSYPARGPYFGRYIRIVGRQVHPALSVTAEAEVVVDDMLHHIFHQLAKEIKAMGRAGTHLHASDPGASDPGASAAPSEDEAAPLATRRCSTRSGTK